jgi:hypothetical protein
MGSVDVRKTYDANYWHSGSGGDEEWRTAMVMVYEYQAVK